MTKEKFNENETIIDQYGVVVKVCKNAFGQWSVWYGNNNKATKLAYMKFFKEKDTAKRWATKFINKK